MSGFYQFKEQDAYDFARHIGARTKVMGHNLHFLSCPYCRSGKDKNTFAIDIQTGKFKCLRASCGASGNMLTLARDFDFSLGSMADEYYRPKRRYRTFKKPTEPIRPKPEAVNYLESRGIPQEIAEKYEITTQINKPNILVFPFYDEHGEMCFVKYRKTDFDKEKDKNKEWCEANGKPILFGMKQCNDKFDRLVITEGQLDSLSVAVAGIENAVSVPTGAKGFTWLPYCWDWLNKWSEIVIFGDYEHGSITLLPELKNRLKSKIKHVREEDYKDCKDANEILQKYGAEQVRQCVENAVMLPLNQIIQLADVKPVDIYKIAKLPIGINQMDRLLRGGLPFGGVTLISGKAGEGKSTFASQILISAIEHGYKCFAYSGELANYLFQAWLNFQVAGSRHIVEAQNTYGDLEYGISNTNINLITEWYRDKIWLYDNSSVVDKDELKSLLELIENTIMQYGVKVILLDNLMTALDLEEIKGNDKYERQGLFAKSLARIAQRYDVLILLVAHKRKNNFSTNENDEIMGSSDISNIAAITIAYECSDKIDEDKRLCKISKNRLFGKKNTNGWILSYDEKSKRIYGDGDDKDIEYSWNPKDREYIDDNINGENPFT